MMNKINHTDTQHKTKPNKKAKKWTWSKPKDKPKRPLSAYNIFFKHTRSRIVQGLSEEATEEEVVASIKTIFENSSIKQKRDRRTHGKISFGNLASAVSEKWKNTDNNRMALFRHYAELDKKRYYSEIAIWKAKKDFECQNTSSSTSSTSTDGNNSTHLLSLNLDISESSYLTDSQTSFCEEQPYEVEPRPFTDLQITKERTTDNQPQTIASSSINKIQIETKNEEFRDNIKWETKFFEDMTTGLFDLKNRKNQSDCDNNGLNLSTRNPLYEVVPISVEPSLQRKRLESKDLFLPLNIDSSNIDEEIFTEDYKDNDLDPTPINEIDDFSKWFF